MAIPEFKENLAVQTPQVVSGSGIRAQASTLNTIGNLSNKMLNDTAVVIGEQRRLQAARGEIPESELPDPGTIVGDATRKGFAEHEAYQTQISIRSRIGEITNREDLTTSQMAAQIQAAREEMVRQNIPELQAIIDSTFATHGISSVDRVSKQRLAQSRARTSRSLEENASFYLEQSVSGAGLVERNKLRKDKLEAQLASGDITLDDFAGAMQEIGDSGQAVFSQDLASYRAVLDSQVEHGDITEADRSRLIKKAERSMMQEVVRENIAERGFGALEEFRDVLTRDELVSVLNKEANFANTLNNINDYNENKNRERKQEAIGRSLEEIYQDIDSGEIEDISAAEQRIQQLEIIAVSLGDTTIGNQIRAAKDDLKLAMTDNIPAEQFEMDFVTNAIALGDLKSMEDVKAYEDDNNVSFSRVQRQEFRKAFQSRTETVFNSRTFTLNRERIKREIPLPDDTFAGRVQRDLSGSKLSPEQQLIQSIRTDLENDLIAMVEDTPGITPQQISDFVDRRIQGAKKFMRQGDRQLLIKNGIDATMSKREVFDTINTNNPAMLPEQRKQLFKSVIKAMDAIMAVENNISITGEE